MLDMQIFPLRTLKHTENTEYSPFFSELSGALCHQWFSLPLHMVPRCRGLLLAMLALLLGHAAPLVAQTPAAAAEDIRGPKSLVEIPQPAKPPVARWLGVGSAAAVLALVALGWWRRRNRHQARPPQEIALAALAELEAGRESLAAEAFANRAADIVRQYIAGRFGLAAPRRTTEEFLRALGQDAFADFTAESEHLRAFLKSCDLAKFAGVQLDSAQREELVQTARAFVTATAAPVRLRIPTATERGEMAEQLIPNNEANEHR